MNEPVAGLRSRNIIERRPRHTRQSHDLIAEEVPVVLIYNGHSHAVMMTSPIDLDDFAIGFSLTEGIINEAAQIQSIDYHKTAQGISIDIKVSRDVSAKLADQKRQISGRTGCGICGISDLAAALPNLTPLDKSAPPAHDAISTALTRFKQQQSLQLASGATHAAALCSKNGELKLLREDIGRHNALDKVIGAREKVPQLQAKDDFLLLSSRASHELVNKAVIAQISSLVTISAATSLAVDLAQKFQLNLIGFIRGDRQIVYR